jgi:response regulator RpfG family c-di-GMP phosphodiesterase
MERGRILIMGQTKESTYEIRNMLDNKLFELEIALSRDVGKLILSQRRMNLIIIHTEMINSETQEFLEFLEEKGINIPIFILGEEAKRFRESMPACSEVACFEKPYAAEEVLTSIKAL